MIISLKTPSFHLSLSNGIISTLTRETEILMELSKTLLKFIRPPPNSVFECHNPQEIKFRTRLRLGFRNLHEHKFKHIMQSELSLKTVPCDFFVRSNSYTFLGIVWVLRDFRAIRLVTSRCIVDSFSLHNKLEKKHRCQLFFCILVTWYDVVGSHSNKKNFRKSMQITHEKCFKIHIKNIYWKFIVHKLNAL